MIEGARRREAIHLMRRHHDTAEGRSEDWRPALGGHHRYLFAGHRRAGVEHFGGPLTVALQSDASFASVLEA